MFLLFAFMWLGSDGVQLDFIADEHLYQPISIRVDKQHRIFVVNSGDHRILVYDQAGNLSLTIGRQGVGPGEMELPTDVGFLNDGRILVADGGNRRIQIFNGQGKYLDLLKIPNQTIGRLLVLPNDEFVLSRSHGMNFDIQIGKEKSNRFNRYALNGELMGGFGEELIHKNPLLATWLNRGPIDILGDRIVFAGSISNDLIFYQGDRETRARFPLRFEPREPKERMRESVNPDGTRNFQMSLEMDLVSAAVAFLSADELLLLRANQPAGSDDETPGVQLIKIDSEGKLLKTYPGLYDASDMALSPDKTHVYLLNEWRDEWVVSKLAL